MDELCMKSGVELRHMFEELSGSIKYKEEFDKKHEELVNIRTQINENKEDLRRQRKNLKQSKGNI